jgi:hypothetical protein
MNDDAKIYELYAENAHAQNEQPQMHVDEQGNKSWWLQDKLHRIGAPALEHSNGTKMWFLHGKQHREDGPATEYADGYKAWYLNNQRYSDVDDWARDVLKMHNKPHDDADVNDFLRDVLMKDNLI